MTICLQLPTNFQSQDFHHFFNWKIRHFHLFAWRSNLIWKNLRSKIRYAPRTFWVFPSTLWARLIFSSYNVFWNVKTDDSNIFLRSWSKITSQKFIFRFGIEIFVRFEKSKSSSVLLTIYDLISIMCCALFSLLHNLIHL